MDAQNVLVAACTRLVAARVSRGKSQTWGAAKIGVSAGHYAAIENGRKTAEFHIEKIAEAYNYPVGHFYLAPLTVPHAKSFSYRRLSSMKAGDRNKVECIATMFAADFRPLVGSYVRLQEPTTPNLSALAETEDHMACGEAVSATLRGMFGMGNAPLRSALDLAESMGISVFWLDGPHEFDGLSFWIDGLPFIFLNRNQKDGYRHRFTVLHEIAHLLLHRRIEEHGKAEDKQANCFASAMLMPSATYGRTARRQLSEYAMLEDRRIWGASVRAQVRRAHDLKIMSDWHYRDAYIRMNKLWGVKEPNPIAPESSTVHRFFFDEAGDRGEYSFVLANKSSKPYDLFLDAFPFAREYEETANQMPSF